MLEILYAAIAMAWAAFGVFALTVFASVLIHGRGDAALRRSRSSAFFQLLTFRLVAPFAAAAAAIVFARMGAGFIPLPKESLWVIPGFILYLLAADLIVYTLHRLQHRIAFLWSMHSLHHAETRVTMVTAYVNYWGETVIQSIFIYPLLLVVFEVPPAYAFIGSWFKLFQNLFVHAEIRLNIGPLGYVLVGPQYHRLHHSSDPAHFNANYAGTFSLWDLLFGTFVMPGKDQYPTTGLNPPEPPQRSFATLWWPLRNALRQRSPQT